jgi:hypothetical protein
MSFVASNIATVPSVGFKWYLTILEGPFSDEIKREIDAHFLTLGRAAGKDVLVVRGFDPTEFRESVEAAAFYDEKWFRRVTFPSLIVTNETPSRALAERGALDNREVKVMVFPLADIYKEHQSITRFLTDLIAALKQPDAVEALQSLNGDELTRGWSWLSKYVKMEPGFFGFNLKLNEAIKDLLA